MLPEEFYGVKAGHNPGKLDVNCSENKCQNAKSESSERKGQFSLIGV